MRKLFIETCHDCPHVSTRERTTMSGIAQVMKQSFGGWSVFDPTIGETIGDILQNEDYCKKIFLAVNTNTIHKDCPLEKMNESEIIIYNLEKEIKKDEENDESENQSGP